MNKYDPDTRMTLDELLTALQLGEDQEVEFKSAAGGLPRSLWESVSALANTEGAMAALRWNL